MNTQATTNNMLSFLDPAKPQPWASFIEQIDRPVQQAYIKIANGVFQSSVFFDNDSVNKPKKLVQYVGKQNIALPI
jgi:hypothetical protein